MVNDTLEDAHDGTEFVPNGNSDTVKISMATETNEKSEKFEKPEVAEKSEITEKSKKVLIYSLEDKPPQQIAWLLGFQIFMTSFGSFATYVHIIAPKLCIHESDPVRADLLSAVFVSVGLATLIQSTIGVRLPLVQGATFMFLAPIISILSLPAWKCNYPLHGPFNETEGYVNDWKERVAYISGGLFLSAVFEFVIGASGLLAVGLKYASPLVIGPITLQLGVSLINVAGREAATNWYISIGTAILIAIFSQYISEIYIPIPRGNIFQKLKMAKVSQEEIDPSKPVKKYRKFFAFKMFSVLLTIGCMWLVCYFTTIADLWDEKDPARTDSSRNSLLNTAPWFRIPYPLQWGLPALTVSAFVATISSVIVSIFDSIGDYYACAAIATAPAPPIPVINRGILVEAIGCILASLFGSCTALSSYSSNIGSIAITKVASRQVMICFSFILIIVACCGKISAIFVLIPSPILGGILVVMISIIIAVGISLLKGVDLDSPRNLFVLGVSLFAGMYLPYYIKNTPTNFSDDVKLLLSNHMLITAVISIVLDNSIPGTREERGCTAFQKATISERSRLIYSLPWNLDAIIDRILPFPLLHMKPASSSETA